MKILTENIADVEADRLRKWLANPAADVFTRVIESKIFECEARAVEHLQADTTAGMKTAEADIEEAAKTKYILELFKQMRKQQTFTTARALPTTTSSKI